MSIDSPSLDVMFNEYDLYVLHFPSSSDSMPTCMRATMVRTSRKMNNGTWATSTMDATNLMQTSTFLAVKWQCLDRLALSSASFLAVKCC